MFQLKKNNGFTISCIRLNLVLFMQILRKVGHDPFIHGRVTVIVNRGFIAFIKQNNRMLYKPHPLLAVQYKVQ